MFKQWQYRVAMLLIVLSAKSVCAQVGEFIWRSSTIGGGGFCMENRFAPSGFFGLPHERSFYLATDVAGVFRSLTMDASGNVTSWDRLYDEATTTSQHVLPRYTTTLAFTKKYNNASDSRLIAGSSEGIFVWSNPYTWQATAVPTVSSIANMDPGDGRYPWIGIIRECWPDSTPFLAAGIGNIRAVVENTPADPGEFGVGGMLRSLDGGANWEFVPLDGAGSIEVVHDIDYFRKSGGAYNTFITTETAIYFSEDLFTVATGSAVSFKRIFAKNAAGQVLQNLRGAVVLGNAAPLATTDSLVLYVSVCSLDTTGWKTAARTGGVFQVNTNLPQLRSGASLSWTNMPVKNYNGYDECKNVGRVAAKPGATMSNYKMFFSKYNTPFLAATQRLNNVQSNWRRIAGPSENDDNGYNEDDEQSLKFGFFDFDPADPRTHPNVYGCWEYGPCLAKGHYNGYGQDRSYVQVFTDSTGVKDAGIMNYKSRGMDELFFTGQKVLFSLSQPNVLMIGCGDNQLLRSLDRGQSWSSRRLRPLEEWKDSTNAELGYGKVQQYVYHLAYHPDTENTVIASAGPGLQSADNEGELLFQLAGGAGASSTWTKLAGSRTNALNLPNGEIYAFTFDRRNPTKGLFVAVRNNGLYYTQVETNGNASNFVKIDDDSLKAKISGNSGNWHNYSRLEFDPYDDDVLYVSRFYPGGGVFKITLGVNGSNRAAITSGGAYNQNFITSVKEVISGRVNAAGSQKPGSRSNLTADVINLLITEDHVYAGVTCGDKVDDADGNYSGGLVQWAKNALPEQYFWKIGGPFGVGSVPKTIAIGGLAQDPLYPDTIFAVTERYKLKEKRAADNMLKGEENYKVMNIWRSTNNGDAFASLHYWQTEHRFPSSVSLSFFPDSPDSMIMPTHGNGIWIAHRYDGPPYGPGVGKANAPDSNQAHLPKRFALHANYPNPFNPTTIIKYDLPKAANVKLTIYDVLGRRVRTLLDKEIEAGYQRAQWDGKSDRGIPVASGIYLYRLHTPFFTKVRKMTLLR